MHAGAGGLRCPPPWPWRPGRTAASLLCLLAAAAAAVPPVASARARVIGTLFPHAVALPVLPPMALPQHLPWADVFRPSFERKRIAALRWRVSQQRAEVERCSQEIAGLLAVVSRLTPAHRVAAEHEVLQLRRAAGIAEARILRLKDKLGRHGAVRQGWTGAAMRAFEIMVAKEERSSRVLWAQLSRHSDPWSLLREDTLSLLRMGTNVTILQGYSRLFATRTDEAPRLLSHTAAIMARATQLEQYAPGILLALDGHLELIEPHLDEILHRFDEIEPHMEYILSHMDQLAPHCGALLRHLDALLLYCDDEQRYLPALLEYLPILAPRLDALGPHLALLRPHVSRLLPHLHVIAPCADHFAPHVAVSANADILLFYFSWALRLPFIGTLLRLPGVPAAAAFLSRRLPRRPVRGSTWDLECDWEGCETDYIANAERYYNKPAFSDPVRLAVGRALGERRARAAWWLAKAKRAEVGRLGAVRVGRGLSDGPQCGPQGWAMGGAIGGAQGGVRTRLKAGVSAMALGLRSVGQSALAAAGVAQTGVSRALEHLAEFLSRIMGTDPRPPRRLAETLE